MYHITEKTGGCSEYAPQYSRQMPHGQLHNIHHNIVTKPLPFATINGIPDILFGGQLNGRLCIALRSSIRVMD